MTTFEHPSKYTQDLTHHSTMLRNSLLERHLSDGYDFQLLDELSKTIKLLDDLALTREELNDFAPCTQEQSQAFIKQGQRAFDLRKQRARRVQQEANSQIPMGRKTFSSTGKTARSEEKNARHEQNRDEKRAENAEHKKGATGQKPQFGQGGGKKGKGGKR